MLWLHRALNRWYRLLHILAAAVFFGGFFLDVSWLAVVGGIVMTVEDLCEIWKGELKPCFPVALAFLLAWLIEPWYMGVFWASAVFHVWNIPGDLLVLFASRKSMYRAIQARETILHGEEEVDKQE